MATGTTGRFGAPGMGTDVIRVFTKALELVSSTAVDSDNELLEMVKRAKKDMDKEPFHPPKKSRSVRHTAEATEPHSLGHRSSSSSAAAIAPAADRSSSPPADAAGGGSGGGSAAAAAAAAASGGISSAASGPGMGNANMTHAQARLMNVIRGGPSRGRIEKPKRKVTR